MRLEIDIPDHHYNNIMAIKSINLGRVPYKGIVMYAISAIKHGKVLEQEPWCAGCREYDQEKHCCHRWSKVIRDTVEEIKKEPILNKIRAEIEQLRLHKAQFITSDNKVCIDSQEVLNIIDKYKAESEVEDGECK